MPTQIQGKIENLTQTTSWLGKVGLLAVEGESDLEAKIEETKNILLASGYGEKPDYILLMEALSSGQNKLFYIEKEEKLDSLVLEIVAEFEAGIVNLADRKNQTGLKTAKWNPNQTSLIIIMTRSQIEQSYPRLFEYIGITQSL